MSRLNDWLISRSEWAQDLIEKSKILDDALAIEAQSRREVEMDNASLSHALELEKARRVAAESIAAERASQIDRLSEDVRALQDSLQSRLRSLDALNVRLMEPRAPNPGPTLEKWKEGREGRESESPALPQSATESRASLIRRIHEADRQINYAILSRQNPKMFAPRPPLPPKPI